jgi:hypothetical protein
MSTVIIPIPDKEFRQGMSRKEYMRAALHCSAATAATKAIPDYNSATCFMVTRTTFEHLKRTGFPLPAVVFSHKTRRMWWKKRAS